MPFFTNRGITPLPVGGGGGGWLLDQITPQPTGAFSTRKLKSTATNSVRLVDSAGANPTTIGFDSGTSDLDVAAVNTFYTANSNTANVNGWYDQSGNSRNILSTAQVVLKWSGADSGALQTVNSNPALFFSDAGGRTILNSSLHLSDFVTTTALTVIASIRIKSFVASGVANPTAGFFGDGGNGYFSAGGAFATTVPSNVVTTYLFDSGGKFCKLPAVIDTNYISVVRLTGGTLQQYLNGGSPDSVSVGAIGDLGYQTITMGGSQDVRVLEVLVYNTALSNADINTLCSAGSVTNGNIASRAGVTWTNL